MQEWLTTARSCALTFALCLTFNLRSFLRTCTFAWIISYALGVYQYDQGIPAQIDHSCICHTRKDIGHIGVNYILLAAALLVDKIENELRTY